MNIEDFGIQSDSASMWSLPPGFYHKLLDKTQIKEPSLFGLFLGSVKKIFNCVSEEVDDFMLTVRWRLFMRKWRNDPEMKDVKCITIAFGAGGDE